MNPVIVKCIIEGMGEWEERMEKAIEIEDYLLKHIGPIDEAWCWCGWPSDGSVSIEEDGPAATAFALKYGVYGR